MPPKIEEPREGGNPDRRTLNLKDLFAQRTGIAPLPTSSTSLAPEIKPTPVSNLTTSDLEPQGIDFLALPKAKRVGVDSSSFEYLSKGLSAPSDEALMIASEVPYRELLSRIDYLRSKGVDPKEHYLLLRISPERLERAASELFDPQS